MILKLFGRDVCTLCMYLRAIGESLYQGRKPSGKLVATIMRVQGYFFVTV